jgi:surface polysaccharide O-acyltransferase-like enzyme
MNDTMRERNIVFDNMRLLACIFVIVSHVVSPWTHGGAVDGNQLVANLLDTAGRFAVGVFFMLSGMFALNNQCEDFRCSDDKRKFIANFYINRFVLVVVPAMLFVVFYNVALGGKKIGSLSDLVAFYSIDSILSSQAYALWFVYVLAKLYTITPILWYVLDTAWGRSLMNWVLYLWVTLAVIATSYQLYFKIEPATIRGFFDANITLKNAGYYLIGFFAPSLIKMSQDNEAIFSIWASRLFKLALAVTVGVALADFEDPWHSYRDFVRINIFILTVTAFLLMAHSPVMGRAYPALRRLRRLTFPAYLIHVAIIFFFAKPIQWAAEILPAVGLVMACVAVTALSFCFGIIYNKLLLRPLK